MNEHPILFNGPMVRAILAGRKTQTRRVVKIPGVMPRTSFPITSPKEELLRFDDGTFHYLSTAGLSGPYPCPYGAPGDRLWVRETWGYRCGTGLHPPIKAVIEYQADGARQDCRVPDDEHGLPKQRSGMSHDELERWWRQWRPSIHMPRWASRIVLKVESVRVERLQNISEADARAEGCTTARFATDVPSRTAALLGPENYRAGFACLWDSINAKRGLGWNANPWVWVVEFKKEDVQ